MLLAGRDLPRVFKIMKIKDVFNDNSILNDNTNRQDILSWFIIKPVIVSSLECGLLTWHVVCSCEAGWMYCQIIWNAFGDGLR